MTKALILGCGPAGLLAAHACVLSGVDPYVVSNKIEKSPLGGAQYLHSPIAGMTDDIRPCRVDYIRYGTAVQYARKVYGSLVAPEDTSWDQFPDWVMAWPLNRVYDRLWARYGDNVVENFVDPAFVTRQLEWGDWDYIFSTVPRQCVTTNHDAYKWSSEDIWVLEANAAVYASGQIVYNGSNRDPWYRFSAMFGKAFYEYPAHARPNDPAARRLTKPVSTSAPAPEGIHLVGRYGKWQKGVLVDHAHKEVLSILQGK